MLAITTLAVFTGKRLPDSLAGFTPGQFVMALSNPAALIMFGFLIQGADETFAFAIGFWMMLLGSMAMLVGAAMNVRDDAGRAAPSGPATSF